MESLERNPYVKSCIAVSDLSFGLKTLSLDVQHFAHD